MPWRQETMKDAASCDKPRGAANTHYHPGISESGNRASLGNQMASPAAECIGRMEQTQGTETSQYLEEKKSIEIPEVAASETGRAQT